MPGGPSEPTITSNSDRKPIDRGPGRAVDNNRDNAFPKINASAPPRSRRESASAAHQTRQNTTLMIAGAIAATGFVLSLLGDVSKLGEYVDPDPVRIIGRAVLAAVVLPILIGVYIMPSMIAFNRNHRNAIPILVVNVFAGAFLLPWVGCLAWALSSHVEESRQTVRVIRVNDRDDVIEL